jgi:ABC-type sugar transport system permease subunit
MVTGQKTLESNQPAEAMAMPQSSQFLRVGSRADRLASSVFIMPAVLVVLFLAIFPLLVSLYLSLSHFKFVKGGFEIKFAGLAISSYSWDSKRRTSWACSPYPTL